MRLVDLADRYHLTTVEALDLCLAAGIEAETSDAELDPAQVERWTALADEQRAWRMRDEQERGMRQPGAPGVPGAEPDGTTGEEAPSAIGFDADGGFGPIPPPPWEVAEETAEAAPTTPRAGGAHEPAGWAAAAAPAPQISPLAPAALAFGVLSLIFPFVTGLVGFALGHVAKSRIRASRGGLTGARMATVGQVLSVIGIVLWSGLLGLALYNDYQRTNDRGRFADLQVDEGVIQWDGLAPQQCLRVPHAETSVPDWQQVRCDSPHEAEVISVQTVNQAAGTAYPGRASFLPLAKEVCEPQFERYVGVPYARSQLQMGAAFPTAGNWATENDRHVACIVFQENWDYINGTLQGAGR